MRPELERNGHGLRKLFVRDDAVRRAEISVLFSSPPARSSCASAASTPRTPRGVCLLLNGQTEFIEKYFEVIDELRGRGFSVVTFDWRGQGGSDRLLPDPPQGAYRRLSPPMTGSRRCSCAQVVSPCAGREGPAPRHGPFDGRTHPAAPAARSCRTNSPPPSCARPMLGINARGAPWWLVEKIARHLNRKAPSTDFVWGMADRDQLKLPFAQQIVTSDPARYARTQALLGRRSRIAPERPHLGLAGRGPAIAIALDPQSGLCRSYRNARACFSAPGATASAIPKRCALFAARMPNARICRNRRCRA